MFERAYSAWEAWPLWARMASGVMALFVADSVITAWGTRDFIGNLIEAFFAQILYWGGPLLSIAAGVLVGRWIQAKSRSAGVAWGSGIVTAFVLFGMIELGVREIPGVGWRIEAMRDSNCYTDWDGRSNPTVCD